MVLIKDVKSKDELFNEKGELNGKKNLNESFSKINDKFNYFVNDYIHSIIYNKLIPEYNNKIKKEGSKKNINIAIKKPEPEKITEKDVGFEKFKKLLNYHQIIKLDESIVISIYEFKKKIQDVYKKMLNDTKIQLEIKNKIKDEINDHIKEHINSLIKGGNIILHNILKNEIYKELDLNQEPEIESKPKPELKQELKQEPEKEEEKKSNKSINIAIKYVV